MTIKEELELAKEKCFNIALGNGKCWICECEKCKKGKTIHHLWYITDDVIYKNYPQNDSGRLQYYTDLLPLIIKNPKRFMCICNTCHHALGKFCQFGDKKFKKLMTARKMTKT